MDEVQGLAGMPKVEGGFGISGPHVEEAKVTFGARVLEQDSHIKFGSVAHALAVWPRRLEHQLIWNHPMLQDQNWRGQPLRTNPGFFPVGRQGSAGERANPKSEARNPKMVVRHWGFFRISGFGFRVLSQLTGTKETRSPLSLRVIPCARGSSAKWPSTRKA